MSLGLDDVIAAETRLSHVDGENGRLIIRGYDIEQLAGRISVETLLALLWGGLAPGDGDARSIAIGLGQARLRAFAIASAVLPGLPAGLSPVEGLRFMLAAVPDEDAVPAHLLAVAAVPVFVATLARHAAGEAPVAPDPEAGHAADFLHMLRGVSASPAHVHALETYFVTGADHGLNASTFTERVIASTRAGMASSVVGALCALKAPLHGGAPGPVLDMLDDIGAEANICPWLTAALDRGERLMGFGHRIYRVRDPRADVLKQVVAGLRGDANRIHFAEAVEERALALLAERKTRRRLDTNTEFYTALLLEALDLPRALFTSVFAIGRVAGWSAHVMEQETADRIIRPLSRYIGSVPLQAA